MTMDKQKFTFPDAIWAGTDHSLALATEAHNLIMAGSYAVDKADEPEEERSYLLTQAGEVGIVSIKGSLTNRDHWYNRYANAVSYAEIRKALVQAANDQSISAILLDIDSGGGSVAGLADVGDLISKVNDSVKSVYAFTDGTMASAAYWLGSSAEQVFSTQTSMVGSIGVIATHMEYSKAMREAGIGVTVMRAGEYKALVNPYEPLTEAAQKQFQGQLNQAYSVFINHVAARRGVSVEAANRDMGQGREFFGEQALNAGLVDGILSFDRLMGRIQAKLLDSKSYPSNNSVNTTGVQKSMKLSLTEQDIAAIAAGAPATTTTAPAPAAAVTTTTVAPAAADAQTTVTPAAAETTETAPAAEVTQPQEGKQSELVAYLQGQLTTKSAESVALQIEMSALRTQLDAMKASHDGLVAIAAQSVKNMKVALGMSGVDLSGMSAQALLAEHASSAEAFNKAFHAGGVAAVSGDTTPSTTVKPVASAAQAARRAAIFQQPK